MAFRSRECLLPFAWVRVDFCFALLEAMGCWLLEATVGGSMHGVGCVKHHTIGSMGISGWHNAGKSILYKHDTHSI